MRDSVVMVEPQATTSGVADLETLFPAVPRVSYGKNPLEAVIAQIRFPPILRIDATPADFQERVRHEFPIFRENTDVASQLPPEIANSLPPPVVAQIANDLKGALGARPPNYSFATDDGALTVGLARDSISLTTTRYSRWEAFRDSFLPAVEALVEIYEPSHYTRVGLRYRDVICRDEIGLDGVPWAELIAGPVAAELSERSLEPAVDLSSHQAHLRLGDGVDVLLQHGLGVKQDTKEACFIIDCDFSTSDRTEVSDASLVLERLHAHAGRVFRWTITDFLHTAMDPTPLE